MLTTGRAIFRNVALQNWRAGGGDGSRNLRTVARGNFRRQASNTWSATYQSTKQAFESHRAVFTIGTSILSILTAWAGYSIRHIHETKVEKRLGSMEEAMKKNYHVEEEIKKSCWFWKCRHHSLHGYSWDLSDDWFWECQHHSLHSCCSLDFSDYRMQLLSRMVRGVTVCFEKFTKEAAQTNGPNQA